MRRVSIERVCEGLGIEGGRAGVVTGYQIDSRLVGPGELFFALQGERVDGHDYLGEVRRRGGVAAVVSEGYRGPDFGLVLLPVGDVVASLQGLARFFMRDCKALVVGVTGSLGKTTAKEFIATLLEGRFKVGKTHLNYNTKLTYPITLLNREGDEEVLVVEMGMTEAGDLKRLVEIAAPDVAVVTKVALVHGAFFPRGVVDIANGKVDIFSHPKTKKCLFDHGLYAYPEAIGKIHGEKITFSLEDRGADYFLSEGKWVDERGVRAYQLDPPYSQPHVLHNILAAVSVARQLGLEWEEIAREMPRLKLPKMRFEPLEREGVLFINDAYNASPDSMRAALSHLPEPKMGGKRIAVLGRMVDLGPPSDALHSEVGSFAHSSVDHLLVLGKEAALIAEGFEKASREKGVFKPVESFFTFEDLAKRLKTLMNPGDVVLLKASRVVEMENLLKWLS